ncbi:Putative Amine oxidase [Penicillium brasilianum]|uniref:Amine oxidase n=1 Tax=Penicillium brasilianum TaxID=104259 RepID=A0A0F7VC81_PENBI|nr:Putative Amine oxidase [Penicillium brasilianum]
MDELFDVAVIGAGMAGIIAARDLSTKGHKVVLLEARDRLGGRTHMDDACGTVLDMGGGYVHWTQPYTWSELKRHGILVNPPMEGGRHYWLADGAVHSGSAEEFYGIVSPLLERMFADSRLRFPLPFDHAAVDNAEIENETIEDRINSLNLSSYERDVLESVLSGLVHSYKDHGIAQLLQSAATYFGNYGCFFETAGSWGIQGGTKSLIDAILAETTARIFLSTPVSSIVDEGSKVTIETRDGRQFYARSTIVALPLNTISDVHISPDLPAMARSMIAKKNPTMAGKLWIRIRGEVEPFSIATPAGKYPLNAIRTEKYLNGDTLALCMCSDDAAIRAENAQGVQTALEKFIPGIEVVDIAYHSWVADEFAKGGWMMNRPGFFTTGAVELRKPHGNIQFAGGDISESEAGSIEGALSSGAHAARTVSIKLAKRETAQL